MSEDVSERERLQMFTLHISRTSGLTVGTVAELLSAGWEYTERLRGENSWVQPRLLWELPHRAGGTS